MGTSSRLRDFVCVLRARSVRRAVGRAAERIGARIAGGHQLNAGLDMSSMSSTDSQPADLITIGAPLALARAIADLIRAAER